ncbi:MAG: TonB-dependent receptor, partial [Ignavibacteriales bacterium]|nr:TonB-dependent receptor [Ignavibacteriales bacterium]
MMKRLVLCCFVAAQAAFAGVSQKEDTVKTYQLGEFLVTATRGGGTILTLPMAADLIIAKDFLQSRRAGLNDALAGIPGVLAQSRAGGQDLRLTIRGFGARGNGDRSNAATIRGIKLLIDGIPETEPDGRTSLDLIDLQSASRIEVLRTNASMLFGNASGGVINIESLPLFSNPSLELNNLFGSYGLRKNNLKILSPAGSSRFSFSASNSNFDGWRMNSSSTSTQFNGVFSSELDETTKLKLVASGAISKFQIPGALTQAQFDADPAQPNAIYKTRNERRFNQVGRFGFSIGKTFSENHSLEILGFVAPKVVQRSERGTFRDFNRYHLGGGAVYQWTASQVGLLHRVTAGFDEAYQDGTILFYNLVNGERGDSLRTNKREGANTLGAFAQVEIRFLDDFSLTLGGRFDQQKYIS